MEMTDRRLFLQTYSLAQATGAIVERELYAVGLPSFLFGLLSQVHRLQPVAPTQIAAATGTPLTTLRDNIQRLADRGLVRRVPNPADGRSYLLELTTRGDVLVRAAGEPLERAYALLEARLPRPLDEYQKLLDELAAAAEAALAEQAQPAPA
jgi:DNA-binding MarR family transcriptional regulator